MYDLTEQEKERTEALGAAIFKYFLYIVCYFNFTHIFLKFS